MRSDIRMLVSRAKARASAVLSVSTVCLLGVAAPATAADGRAPNVSWKAPSTGSSVSQHVNGTACEAAASDNRRVARVKFFVDSTRLNTERSAPYNCYFDSTKVADGSHVLRAVAYDRSGNRRAASISVSVTNGVTPPIPALLPPTTPPPTTPPPTTPPPTTPPPTGSGPAGIPGTWGLRFSDEFDGTSVDGQKWTANWLGSAGQTTKPINSAEQAAYAPAQATVSGGMLKLTALQQPTSASDGKTYAYRSGMVQSNGKYNFTYGAMEARVYSPGTSGGHIYNWPAFWTDGQNWPADGEIDVYEGLSGRAAWHYHYSGGGPGATVPGTFTGWHTFAANWEPGKISFYYDGKLVGTQTSGVVNKPHFLILNYGVGGWGGEISVRQTMQVDYVRVWQR